VIGALEKRTADLHYATPDFLLVLVALANFMRLSLLKAAHAVVSSAAWRKSGYAPVEMTILFED
jgi:hypothetical protein